MAAPREKYFDDDPLWYKDAVIYELPVKSFADIWSHAVSGVYLNAYLFEVDDAPFAPRDRKEVDTLLRCFLMERAVHDLGRELDNRPDWIVIPIRGIERLLKRA